MPTGQLTSPTQSALGYRQITLPVSVVSDWVDVCNAPTTDENDAGVVAAGTVVAPTLVTRVAQNWLFVAGLGSTVQVRLKYPTAGSVTTSPVVQMFGRDRRGVPQRLVDGSGVHALALSVDAASDVRDAATPQMSYTQPVEVDADGCAEVLAAVRTALAGTGLTGATIQARVK
ncbi:MAG: hypothetical protein AB7U73_05870 [Pirellulales bacterium]